MKMQLNTWLCLFLSLWILEVPAQPLNEIALGMIEDVATPKPKRFIVFGDTELSPEHDIMMEDIKNRYTSADLAFVVNVGDFLSASTEAGYTAYYDKTKSWMEETGIAVLSVPGNHEMDCGNCLNLYTSFIGDVNWKFDYQGSSFVGILNAQLEPGYVGPGLSNEVLAFGIPATTIQEISQYLKATSYDHLFSFTHVPLVWSNNSCNYNDYLEYYSMLVQRDLTANFAGHLHYIQKEYQCNTGAFEIVSGAGGPNLVQDNGNSPPNHYEESQAYVEISFINSWEAPYLDLYTSSDNNGQVVYNQNSTYACYLDESCFIFNCGCDRKRPLYNDKVQPIINFVESNDACYTCIENLTRNYSDLTVRINDAIVTDNVNLSNAQLCFKLEDPSCEAKVEVEYVSCASKEVDCGTTSVIFDPNDLQSTLENMILEISECEDGIESAERYLLLQGNNAMDISAQVVTPTTTVAASTQVFTDDEVLITWDDNFAKELILNVSFEYCSCLIEEEVRIPLPPCTIGECCPPGSEFDGAHCYFRIHVPDGYDPFIWNNSFYTHYGPGGAGDCPPGTVDDGAHCHFRVGFPDYYDGFVWEDKFYTHENCDIEEFCCPEGSKWNGQVCELTLDWTEEEIVLLEDNTIALVYDESKGCPTGTTLDAEGKYCLTGTSIPERFEGTVNGNVIEIEPNCESCCPGGFEFDGLGCTREVSLEGAEIYGVNSQIAVRPDCKLFAQANDCCPEGFYNDQNGNCLLLASTNDLSIQFNWTSVTLGVEAEDCFESESRAGSVASDAAVLPEGEDVLIYPNPAQKTIHLMTSTTELYQIQIFDQAGRVVVEKNKEGGHISLDVEHLAAGIYFIKVVGADKKMMSVQKLSIL